MFRRKRQQDDFNAEIQAHLDQETERLKEHGMSEEDARFAARRAFGNVACTLPSPSSQGEKAVKPEMPRPLVMRDRISMKRRSARDAQRCVASM